MGTLLSASQAAKLVGKSVPTITRAIKNGRLSATKLESGGYEIDPAELARVWDAVTVNDNATPEKLQSVTHNETNVLQVKLEAKDEILAEKERTIERLEKERNEWRQQAQTLAITNQNKPPEQQAKDTRGLWARILNK